MPLDAEDEKKVGEIFLKIMGSDEYTKSFAKTIESVVGRAVKGAVAETDKRLEALKSETDKKLEGLKSPEPLEKKPGGDNDPKIEDAPAFKRVQAEFEEMKKKAKVQEERAEAAEAKRKQDLLANNARDALIANGADPARVAIAMSHLKATGRVALSDKDEPIFMFEEKWGPENVPVAEGAKRWLASEEGKFFLPPSNRQGTGDNVQRGNGAPPTTNAPRTATGEVDWAQLGSRMSLGVLEKASDG